MNIGENQNSEFIKLQPAQEKFQTPNVAVVNGETQTASGGDFLPASNTESGKISFLDELTSFDNKIFESDKEGLFSFQIAEGLSIAGYNDDDFSEIQNIDSISISADDAKFFVNLVQHKELNTVKSSEGSIEIKQSEKTMEVSKTLINLLSKANTEGKPLRLDFDNNITLVLKISQDGKINANFFPSDKSAEEYLRNNIPYLKQEFELKNISYGSLNYFNQRKQRKENNNE